MAQEIEHDLQSIKDTNKTEVTGGRPRQIRVELDPEALAFNVPVSVMASTLVAFLVTPWLASKLLKPTPEQNDFQVTRTGLYRGYASLLKPLLDNRRRSWIFLVIVMLLFCVSMVLPVLRLVPQLSAEIDALKKQYPVVVDEIVPSADPGSRSFLVKVSLADDSGLYPGMFGRLMIPIGQVEKITIPLEAVTAVGQLNFVIVKTQQGAVRRYVRLGERRPDHRLEVISGLAAGDQILISAR